MDSQMQERFLQHIFTFFSLTSEDKCSTNLVNQDAANVHAEQNNPEPKQKCPDLPEILGLLRATGFVVQYSDKSEFGGSSTGCRAVIMCKRSGTRVVLDNEGACTCPPEATLKQYLDAGRAGPPLSRAPSPTPSTCSILEAADKDHGPSLVVLPQPPGPTRQKTWSRDDNAILEEEAAADSRSSRRLSAPPLQSAWTTMNGDDLNVLAATDLLQEAMSLLSGIKKVNLRNTPVGPTRRLSATSRRASSDAFVMPMRPSLTRTSSVSSGLASSRSTSSLVSTHSAQSDTPRPPRPGAGAAREGQGATAAATLRRTVSGIAGASLGGPGPGAPAPAPKNPVARTKSDASKPSCSKVASFLKTPSAVSGKATLARPIARPRNKLTNSSMTSAKQLITPKPVVKSPEVESVKL